MEAGSGSTIGLLVPMPIELKPLVKRLRLTRSKLDDQDVWTGEVDGSRIVTRLIGIGPERARQATRWMIDRVGPDWIMISGVAGGLGANVGIGDLVVPEKVTNWKSDHELRPTPIGPTELSGHLVTTDELSNWETLEPFATAGALAVDMEASGVGEVCEEHGVPWIVFRGVSDMVNDDLVDADVGAMARDDGSADVGAAIRYVLRHPGRIPSLVRVGRDAQRAASVAAAATVRAVQHVNG